MKRWNFETFCLSVLILAEIKNQKDRNPSEGTDLIFWGGLKSFSGQQWLQIYKHLLLRQNSQDFHTDKEDRRQCRKSRHCL